MVFTGLLTANSSQEPLFRDREGKTHYEIGGLDDLICQSQILVEDWLNFIRGNQSGPPPTEFIERVLKIHDAYEQFMSEEQSEQPQADAEIIEKLSLVQATLDRMVRKNA